MQLHPKAFANASALVVGALYLVCAALVAIAPDFFLSVANSWVHALDLTKIKAVNFTAGKLLIGLVSITVVSWAVDYLFAVVYNLFVKTSER